MDWELDDTVRQPPRHRAPLPVPYEDFDDTVIPVRGPGSLRPWALVEPGRRAAGRDVVPISSRQANAPGDGSHHDARGGANDDLLATGPIELPEFHRFRVAGQVHPLDAVAYIGRRPSSPRIVTGQLPRLVRVPSIGHEVSSTHLELRQIGDSVVLTDMWSTNGSIVRSPGSAPRKLRQGESVVAPPGTLVDVGDGNLLEILLPYRPGQ